MTLKQNQLELDSFRKNQLKLLIHVLGQWLEYPQEKPWAMNDPEGKKPKAEIRRLIRQFEEELSSRRKRRTIKL